MFEGNAAFLYFFFQEQGGDKESADHKEYLYADDAVEVKIEGGIFGDVI